MNKILEVKNETSQVNALCFIEKNPIGAECKIRYLDDEAELSVYISFGAFTNEYQHDGFGVDDDFIFYYASDDGEKELKSLMTPSAADFVILSYTLNYEWPTKAIYCNNGHAITNSPKLVADEKRGCFVDVTKQASYQGLIYEFVGISTIAWLKAVNPVEDTFNDTAGYNSQQCLDELLNKVVRDILYAEEPIERKPSNFPRVIKFEYVRANEVISLKLLYCNDLDKLKRIYLKDATETD